VSYTPLQDPENEAHVIVPPLQRAIDRAREVLEEKGQANIHDQDAMIRAAYGLHYVLRDLLAALDAERGEQS
jgi:broad specificity phosphatase PhoE